MAKLKQPILTMTPQELLKSFVSEVGKLIKAENETLKTILMAEIKAAETRMKAHTDAAIKASEERTHKDINRLEQKLDNVTTDHEDRIVTVEHELFEDETGTPPHKN